MMLWVSDCQKWNTATTEATPEKGISTISQEGSRDSPKMVRLSTVKAKTPRSKLTKHVKGKGREIGDRLVFGPLGSTNKKSPEAKG